MSTDLQAGRRTRYTADRTEAKALEAALLAATGKRWAVVYHSGTARGWFDVLPLKRDRRTITGSHLENGEHIPTERYLRGAELAQVQKDASYRLVASAKQRTVLKALFGEYFTNSNVPGDEAWLTWAANGRQGAAPRMGSRDWD